MHINWIFIDSSSYFLAKDNRVIKVQGKALFSYLKDYLFFTGIETTEWQQGLVSLSCRAQAVSLAIIIFKYKFSRYLRLRSIDLDLENIQF